MVEGDPQEDAEQLLPPLPMHAAPPLGNSPPPPGHMMELPLQRTWTTLVEEAELPLHSHAYQIFQQHQEEEWEVTMHPFTRLVEAARNPNYDTEEAMFEFADSLEHPLFLVVKDTKFQVIHGMRRCTPIHGLGARLSWLLGDRQLIAGQVVPPPPGLIIKAQGQNTQSDLFARIATNAAPLDAILLAFQADPTVALHDLEPAHTISSWAVLPIPGRFTCLFMKGLPLIEGFVLGCKLLHLTPDRFAEEKELWAGFLRSAVTRRTVGDDTSALTTVWVRKDLYSSVGLTNWYFALVSHVTGPSHSTAYAANAHAAPAYAAPAHSAPAYAAQAHAANHIVATAYVANAPPAQVATAHAATAYAANAHAADLSPGLPEFGVGEAGLQLLPGAGDRADLTMTTIDLLQAMTERLSNGALAGRSTVKNYDWVELEYLFQSIGTPQIRGSFTRLGAESLPKFFQSLATTRGEKANTRLFVERYWATHYPQGSIKYDFVWTTQLVKDLKYLSFGGDDLTITHQNHFRGISLFSLAPVSEASMANGVATRQQMLHFESMEGDHMPTDALEMAKLSATGSTIPGSRAEAQAWLDHAGIMTKMIMGDACLLNWYLDTIRSCLWKPHLFVGWSEAEWRAFVWSGHMAYRAFMCDTTITPLAQLAGDMEARKRPDVQVLPDKCRMGAPTHLEDHTGRKRASDGPLGPGRNPAPFGNPAADSLAAHLSSMLSLAKPKTSKDLKISFLLPTDGDIDHIIGPEFLGLCVPRRKPLWWRHHIYGVCREDRQRVSMRARFLHKTLVAADRRNRPADAAASSRYRCPTPKIGRSLKTLELPTHITFAHSSNHAHGRAHNIASNSAHSRDARTAPITFAHSSDHAHGRAHNIASNSTHSRDARTDLPEHGIAVPHIYPHGRRHRTRVGPT
jgi:hypothetical protein